MLCRVIFSSFLFSFCSLVHIALSFFSLDLYSIKRNRVTAATIFEEVPVVLRMSSLAKAIIPDLTGQMDQENVRIMLPSVYTSVYTC